MEQGEAGLVVNLADIFAKLGVKIDHQSFAAGERAMATLVRSTGERIAAGSAHFGQVVLDTSRAARRGVDDAVVGWGEWDQQLERSRKKTFSWGKALVAGFVAVAAVRIGARVVNDVVQTGDAMDELSQRTGVNVESLQALGYAAGFSDVSTESLGKALGFLGKNAALAVDGSERQSKAFRTLGVDAKALVEGTLPIEDALGTIADKIAGMRDGAAKRNIVRDALGKGGDALIPFLNEGAAGIKRLTDEARAMGIVIKGGDTKALVDFANEQDRIAKQWKAAKQQLVIALLPALRGLLKVFGGLIAVFRFFQDNIKIVVMAIGALTAAYIIHNAAAIRAGIAAAWAGRAAMWAWLKAAVPVVLIGAALLAVALIVEDVWHAFTGGKSVLKDLYDAAVEWLTWDKIWEGLKIGIGAVLAGLGEIGAKIADKLGLGTTFLFGEGGQSGVDDALSKYMAPVNQAKRRADLGFGVTGGHIGPAMPGSAAFGQDAAAAAGARSTQLNVNSPINVTVPPGTDAGGVALAVQKAFSDMLDGEIRKISAATSGGKR